MFKHYGEAEKQLLVSILALNERAESATLEALEKFGEFYFCAGKLDWAGYPEKLLASGTITNLDDCFSVNPAMLDHVRELLKAMPRSLYWYEDCYDLAMKSKVHSKLCSTAYGKDLCQTGMVTISQIDKVVEIIKKNGYRDCIDLGCGNGLIDEHISDESQARITGIDRSRRGIKQAKERTRRKADRLRFISAGILEYDYGEDSYATVLSFDTLYCFSEQETTTLLEKIRRALRPNGSLIVFYSAGIPRMPHYSLIQPNLPVF